MSSKKEQKWTPEEIEQLRLHRQSGQTVAEIAPIFNRSFKSIERALARYDISSPVADERDFSEEQAHANSEYWKCRHKELTGKYRRLMKAGTVTQQLVDTIRELAPTSYTPHPTTHRKPRPADTGEVQHAVLHLSDTHIGQQVTADQTMTFGDYNFDVFTDRLCYLEKSLLSICNNHVNTQLPKLVIAWGGDLLHGNLEHANEAAHIVDLFSQYYSAGHLFAQFLRNVAPHFEAIECQSVVGNHTRWMNQRKMPTVNRFSNLDHFVVALTEALTRELSNVKWCLTKQPFAEFDVLGWRHHLSHGDHLRGGDKALGVPSHAFGRELSVTSQLYAKHSKLPINYFLHGHFHRPMELPHASGEILVNGGWAGIDEYGLTNNFNPCDPQQRLYFVHRKFGRTANYYLSLAHAKAGSGLEHYTKPKFS